MKKDYTQPQNAAVSRRRRRLDNTVRLGDVVVKLMDESISPRHERFGSVSGAWQQLLPAELGQHCRLAGVTAGRLKVLVDSPVYMYELQLCSSRLLEQLQQQCPRVGIRQIKFSLG